MKPLLELNGRPLVRWALDAALTGGAQPVLVVTGHQGGQVAGAAPQGVMAVRAPHWRKGIARSLRAALDALEGWTQVSAVCIGLSDQPLVGADAYRRLIAAGEQGAQLAVATYGGTRGNPVLLGRSLWPEARMLEGDEGGRVLMRTHDVVEVDCTDIGDPKDIDTLDDLAALQEHLEA